MLNNYEEVLEMGDSLCFAKKNGKYGIIDTYPDKECQELSEFVYDRFIPINVLCDSLFLLKKEGKLGLFCLSDKERTEFVYEKVIDYGHAYGFLRAKKNGKWGILCMYRGENSEFIYDEISEPVEIDPGNYLDNTTIYIAKRNGKYGIIRQENGEEQGLFEYDYIDIEPFREIFSNGLTRAKKDGKTILITDGGVEFTFEDLP